MADLSAYFVKTAKKNQLKRILMLKGLNMRCIDVIVIDN